MIVFRATSLDVDYSEMAFSYTEIRASRTSVPVAGAKGGGWDDIDLRTAQAHPGVSANPPSCINQPTHLAHYWQLHARLMQGVHTSASRQLDRRVVQTVLRWPARGITRKHSRPQVTGKVVAPQLLRASRPRHARRGSALAVQLGYPPLPPSRLAKHLIRGSPADIIIYLILRLYVLLLVFDCGDAFWSCDGSAVGSVHPPAASIMSIVRFL